MKLNKLRYIAIAALGLSLGSCNDFLGEMPSKTSSVVPTEVGHLHSLLNNYRIFAEEQNTTLLYSSDDFELNTDLFDARPNILGPVQLQYALWDTENIPQADDRNYFSEEWGKIYNANLVMYYLDNIEGSEEEKAALKAEAHFIRVYSYYQMVNTFCLPYTDANSAELGLPIKRTTSFEESVERADLQTTWEFMAADLEEALKLNVDLEQSNSKNRTWRASTPAVYAFAARFYLSKNDYANAQKYADMALAQHSDLMDYNTDMYYSPLEYNTVVDGQPVEYKYPYTHDLQIDPTDRMEWRELYYYRFLSNGYWWNIPSQELLNLYDQGNDLRYRYHMVEDYSYDRGMISPAYSYPGYIFFFKGEMPSGPTTAEMYLIKAECQVRSGSWNEGLATANILRAARMDASATAAEINLSASSEAEALTMVLAERRREMPFTQRWFDVRRYNNNETPADDVVMSRSFYPFNGTAVDAGSAAIEYSLPANSRRFAAPLPTVDITNSKGQLKQNTY